MRATGLSDAKPRRIDRVSPALRFSVGAKAPFVVRAESFDSGDNNIDREGEKRPRGARALSGSLSEGAGAVFVLAGFLKILIVCFPFSTMAISMYFQGLCDLGYLAALKMMPLAIGILALAKAIVDRKLQERKWAPLVITLGGVVSLAFSRWAFARPRPSPLDPMLAHYHRLRVQEANAAKRREFERRNATQESKRKSIPDPRSSADAKVIAAKNKSNRFS